ncbi:hypothetical protein Agub_g6004 [Astrephomene gubernaculifera]|uniref:Uncharacterized protein n=1 Tax=Astrephomene gubernaculifera TaxID=47775 RepID=A0AAD3DPM0_9CHLO|nr:hypothetical protein Agub_g6004 [Astrephomene gubernaculifera]
MASHCAVGLSSGCLAGPSEVASTRRVASRIHQLLAPKLLHPHPHALAQPSRPGLPLSHPRAANNSSSSTLQTSAASTTTQPPTSPSPTTTSSSNPSSSSSSPSPSSEPAAPSTHTPSRLTTWQYSKLADPGFAPWFLGLAFLPFLLLLVPLLSSPPMPPVAAP